LKTQANEKDVAHFLSTVEPKSRREDALQLMSLLGNLCGWPAQMWGDAIVGFGSYRYQYASGRSGDWMRIGFSPRKSALVLYVMDGFSEREQLLERLGKPKLGKSCLYIKRLKDLDTLALSELIEASLARMQERYPE